MAKMTANERFAAAAKEHDVVPDITRFPEDTRTAEQAAVAIGCDVAQIVKSLVFAIDGSPILVLTSGSNQVATDKVGELLSGSVERADAKVVRATTGYAIGGVPPFGHSNPVPTLIDRDLMAHEIVWGAAGTPDTVFPITPSDLVRTTGARVEDVAR